MKVGLIFLSLCFSIKLLAQEDITVKTPADNRDSLRDLYINRFPDHFFIYPVIKQRSLSFELEKRDRSELLTFKPNNTFSLGLGAYLFEAGVELAFAIPLDEKSKSIYGNSDARDIQLNIFGKKWGLDAFYQKYSGFYITDKTNPTPPDTAFPQRADIESKNAGLTGLYIFNNQKFSFRSVYNFAERQLFSRGSFLVSSGLSTFKVSADSSIINGQQKVVFGDDVSFSRLRYTTFSIAPGYTYSIIFKNFFLNGTLSIGPAHHWIKYTLEGGPAQDEIAINTFVAARISIGYNGNILFGGISFVTQGSSVAFEDVQFSNSNGSFKILVGYRFREAGVLKKRVWDLMPFKF